MIKTGIFIHESKIKIEVTAPHNEDKVKQKPFIVHPFGFTGKNFNKIKLGTKRIKPPIINHFNYFCVPFFLGK